MNTLLLLRVLMLIIGILINIYIAKLGIIIFRKDNIFSRIVLRFAGIFLIINSIPFIFRE